MALPDYRDYSALGGGAIGLAAAWVASRCVANLVYGATTGTGIAFAASAGVLIALTAAASAVPAIRAARVSPMTALRYE